MKRVRTTREADRDLDKILIQIARDNMDVASRLVDEITARFVIIGWSPEIGRTRDELRSGLRSHRSATTSFTTGRCEGTFPSCIYYPWSTRSQTSIQVLRTSVEAQGALARVP
jgi:plasmid stabilization system protein ParE